MASTQSVYELWRISMFAGLLKGRAGGWIRRLFLDFRAISSARPAGDSQGEENTPRMPEAPAPRLQHNPDFRVSGVVVAHVLFMTTPGRLKGCPPCQV